VKKEHARELLRFLTAPQQQVMEVRQGSVAVRRSVLEQQRREAQGAEAQRLALLEGAIENDLIIPPKLPYYPRMEDILWRNVRAAMTGQTAIADALVEIERRIGECVAHAA
jgi:multiple sugar transport system substrate-binding protein